MKKTIGTIAKPFLLAAFLICTFGQTTSTASVTKSKVFVKTEYQLNCTFTGNRTQKCDFTLNGGAATADGCTNDGSNCSVWL